MVAHRSHNKIIVIYHFFSKQNERILTEKIITLKMNNFKTLIPKNKKKGKHIISKITQLLTKIRNKNILVRKHFNKNSNRFSF